ncbi:hypothetical protein PQR75_45455 [Paraburkholderia fungorum]|uniref:hypothetical protein n=1 Tax=Paraburkholderia fungorum TaxID=134537 RepID=UPI0038BB068A
MRILPISTLLISALLAGMSANAAGALPIVVVSCATPHPDFPRQVSLDVYEFYGTSPSSRCVYTNKGAGLRDKEQVFERTAAQCHANVKEQILSGIPCTSLKY